MNKIDIHKIIPISDLRRRFSEIEQALPHIDHFVLTKKGKPFATLTAFPEVKRSLLEQTAGAWKNTTLDSDKLWREVRQRRSRRQSVEL